MFGRPDNKAKPAVIGSVSAVNGNTITLNGRVAPGNNAATTFSVDASSAKVFKNRATSTVSSIAVGDMLFVEGTVNGTNVTATTIRDEIRPVGFGPGRDGEHKNGSTTPSFVGNGEPLVAGKISAVNGNTLTVTTGNNVTYTVDASNAKIIRGNEAIALSSVAVNDGVLVQGTVNGNSIVASNILERPQPHQNSNSSKTRPEDHGFFGNMGGFFMHLFGF